MALICLLRIHDFGGWTQVQELPLWRNTRAYGLLACGYQPTCHKVYSDGKGGFIDRIESDLNYLLVGKVIEQKRTCKLCYQTQARKQKWAV